MALSLAITLNHGKAWNTGVKFFPIRSGGSELGIIQQFIAICVHVL